MGIRTFAMLAGILFLARGLGALGVIFLQWDVTLNGWVPPMWIYWVAAVVLLFLGYQGIKLGRR